MLRVTKDGVVEVYERGPFLGMMPDVEIATREVRLAPGDRLLAYTDGIYEQENAKGDLFGFEPMNAVLSDRALTIAKVLTTLEERLVAFALRPQLDDDVTLICIERTSPSGG